MKKDETPHSLLGLPPKAVRLREYSPDWDRLYQGEEAVLKKTLGTRLVDIQHVGSTAVPGLKAKPIIDILAGVAPLALGATLIAPLREIEYLFLGSTLVEGHHVFGKGVHRTHLLHVVEYAGAAWTRVLVFRDILRKDATVAHRYEALKVNLSKKFHNDRAGYAEAKTLFIDCELNRSAQT